MKNTSDNQYEQFLKTSNKKKNVTTQKKSWIQDNFALALAGFVLLLVMAAFLVKGPDHQSSAKKSMDAIQSQTAKQILSNEEKAQANKISFTPSAQRFSYSGQVSADNFLERSLAVIKEPKPFLGVKRSTIFDQLPFCVGLLTDSVEKARQIKESLRNQQHSNYETFSVLETATTLEKGNINLYHLKSMIKKECKENSIIMLVSGPVSSGFLGSLNEIYQTKNVWITYEVSSGELLIHSAYQRVFDLLDKNDFNLENMPYLGKPDHEIIAIGLLQISLDHAENVEKYQVPSDNHRDSVVLRVNIKQHINYKRTPYNPATSLRQAYYLNRTKDAELYAKMLANKDKRYVAEQASVSQEKMLYTLEYLELLYLPSQHFLAKREKEYYESKYELSKISKQLPLCICVSSHDNVENDRHEKVMLSIMQQEYRNYHIVFMDDFSEDETLYQTMGFVKSKGYPSEKIVYVQNLQRNFATYNIINSAFNYCDEDEIQVIINGDDELVGRMTFQLINYFYQHRNNWVVYTTSISSYYTYGSSHAFSKMSDLLDENGQRIKGQWIGHLTTWYVGFLKLMNSKDHKKATGQWYDTLYDDSFQHPLLQMAGPEHVEFVPEISYLDNKHESDSSNHEKIVNRWNLYLELIGRKPYERVSSFDMNYKNIELEQELANDYGRKYRQVDPQEVVSLRKKLKMRKQSSSPQLNAEIDKKQQESSNQNLQYQQEDD